MIAAATATLAPASPVAAIPSEGQIDIAAAGPLGPITVIGDSVLVGASIEPSLPTLLAQQGWGPVRFRAGLGYTAGNFQPSGSRFSAANWISWWRQAGWDTPNVAVNLGNNDVGFCKASIECNATTIRYLLDAIGPGHQVWWSKITRLYTLSAEADAYNQALDLVAAERGNLHVWDWPAVQGANGIALSWDFIHLRDAAAYRQRSAAMAGDITATFARATRTGGDAPLPVAAGTAAEYEPLTPARVLDTRDTAGTRLAAGGVVEVDLGDRVPAGTTAVAVNLTAVDPATSGYLTGYPCGPGVPTVSSVNFSAGTDRGALAVLPLGAGKLCVLSSAAADVIVDLQGAFVPVGARLSPVTPTRLLDTRETGRAQVLELAAPAGATAVALNLTVTGAAVPGFLTAYPCGGALPSVSNVNFGPGETVAGAGFVRVGDGGTVCVFTNTPDVDVVVDLTGTFAADGALRFTPAVPTRVYDTRDGTGGWTPVQGGGQTVDVRVAPPEAAAVTGTLTLVTPSNNGFLTAFGCGPVPLASNVNAPRGGVLANSVTVGTAPSGRLCISAMTATHVVFDTTGWWTP